VTLYCVYVCVCVCVGTNSQRRFCSRRSITRSAQTRGLPGSLMTAAEWYVSFTVSYMLHVWWLDAECLVSFERCRSHNMCVCSFVDSSLVILCVSSFVLVCLVLCLTLAHCCIVHTRTDRPNFGTFSNNNNNNNSSNVCSEVDLHVCTGADWVKKSYREYAVSGALPITHYPFPFPLVPFPPLPFPSVSFSSVSFSSPFLHSPSHPSRKTAPKYS